MSINYEEIINQIDQAIVDLSTGKVKSYKLGDRQFTYYDLDELIRVREYYKSQLIEEEGNYTIAKINVNSIEINEAKIGDNQ